MPSGDDLPGDPTSLAWKTVQTGSVGRYRWELGRAEWTNPHGVLKICIGFGVPGTLEYLGEGVGTRVTCADPPDVNRPDRMVKVLSDTIHEIAAPALGVIAGQTLPNSFDDVVIRHQSGADVTLPVVDGTFVDVVSADELRGVAGLDLTRGVTIIFHCTNLVPSDIIEDEPCAPPGHSFTEYLHN